MVIVKSIFLFLRAFIMGRAAAAVENVAPRQQVAVFKQSIKRPTLRPRDRVFWVVLSRLWPNWRAALAIVEVRNGHQMAPEGIQNGSDRELPCLVRLHRAPSRACYSPIRSTRYAPM